MLLGSLIMRYFLRVLIIAITFITTGYLTYYFLLDDNCLHISITSILTSSQSLNVQKHMLVLTFLPVYIAFIIFGSLMLSIYLGSLLKQLIIDKKKK